MKKNIYSLILFLLAQCTMSFASITDVSTIDNVIYIKPFEASAGSQTDISISMKNTANIRGFQFDLFLPEGITVVKSSKGKILGELNPERLPEEDEHQLTFSEQPTGAIRFLCSSLYDETFTGTDGEIAKLTVNISPDMAKGEYPILMKGMLLNETDISKFYETDLIETIVTINEQGDNRTVLDENSAIVPESATGVNIRVLRTINANEWSTICLPFAMTDTQIKETFGNDVQIANFEGTEPEFDIDDNVVAITAKFTNVNAIEANHPYIIKVSQPMTGFTLDNVDIVASEEDACIEYDNGKTGSRRVVYSGFYGTYRAETVLEEYSLFLNSNKFWYSMGQNKMKAFRAYFYFLDILTNVEEAPKVIEFKIGSDDATAIDEIDNKQALDNNLYNTIGQRVDKDYKGIVIKSGKKYLKYNK